MGFTNLKPTNKLMPLNIQLFAASVSIIEAYETNKSTPNNTNDIYVRVRVSTSGATWNEEGSAYCVITASSSLDTKSSTQYFKIGQNSSKDLGFSLGSFRHHNDGSLGNISISAYVYLTSSTQTSTSGSVWASTIPRYANISGFSVSKISGYEGLTKVKVSYSVSAGCDWVWYSKDNGSTWQNLPNNNIISGLEEGKGYNFKIRVRRSDSQLTTDSGTVYQTTYAKNKITSNFTTANNGKELNVTANNPSGAKCNIKIGIPNTEYEIVHENTTDTTFTVEEIDSFLQYITGSSSFAFRITAITLNDNNEVLYTDNVDGTYQIINSNPIFHDFKFLDINEKTTSLTGNNQDCIIGYSYMKANIPAENKAVAQNYATMNKYRYTIADQTQDFEYNENGLVEMLLTDSNNNPIAAKSGTLTVYAIDSRGLSTPVQKLANNVINYENLIKTDVGSAKRVDEHGQVIGVSETAQISFSGTMWKDNFGAVENSIKSATYRFKKSTGDEWIDGITPLEITVNDNGEFSFKGNIKGDTDLGFDIAYVYIIEVTVEDELSKVVYTLTLGSGKPHVAYARDGMAIMGKYDNSLGGALQVHGDLITQGRVISSIPTENSINVISNGEAVKCGYKIDGKDVYVVRVDLGKLPNASITYIKTPIPFENTKIIKCEAIASYNYLAYGLPHLEIDSSTGRLGDDSIETGMSEASTGYWNVSLRTYKNKSSYNAEATIYFIYTK